jgi:hypothetical protein
LAIAILDWLFSITAHGIAFALLTDIGNRPIIYSALRSNPNQ